MRGWGIFAGLVLLSTSVAAAPGERSAQKHHELGLEHLRAGNLELAAAEMNRAYTLSAQPRILFSLAATFARAGDLNRAAQYYDRFVKSTPPSPEREEAEEKLAAIATLRHVAPADESQAFAASLTTAEDDGPTLLPAPAPPPRARPALAAEVLRPVPTNKPSRKRLKMGLGIGLSLGAAAIAAAVTGGVLANREPDHSLGSINYGSRQ